MEPDVVIADVPGEADVPEEEVVIADVPGEADVLGEVVNADVLWEVVVNAEVGAGGVQGDAGKPRRSSRPHIPTKRCCCQVVVSSVPDGTVPKIPGSVMEALGGPFAENWRRAMEEEIQNMERQET